MIWWTLIILLLAWLAFNWLAPLSILAFAERMSLGRIPADIMYRARAHRVHYYVADLSPRRGAFTTWLGWKHTVVLDRDMLRSAHPAQIRFILAHELGHCALGHLRLRWLFTVTGLILLPWSRRYLASKEEDADRWAEQLSGLPSAVLQNPELADLLSQI